MQLPVPTAPLSDNAKKAIAILDKEESKIAAKALWRRLGLGREKVRAEMEEVAQYGGDDFEFTDGLATPHLWTALRPLTFQKTSNRR